LSTTSFEGLTNDGPVIRVYLHKKKGIAYYIKFEITSGKLNRIRAVKLALVDAFGENMFGWPENLLLITAWMVSINYRSSSGFPKLCLMCVRSCLHKCWITDCLITLFGTVKGASSTSIEDQCRSVQIRL
jgi:hypothetical protein